MEIEFSIAKRNSYVSYWRKCTTKYQNLPPPLCNLHNLLKLHMQYYQTLFLFLYTFTKTFFIFSQNWQKSDFDKLFTQSQKYHTPLSSGLLTLNHKTIHTRLFKLKNIQYSTNYHNDSFTTFYTSNIIKSIYILYHYISRQYTILLVLIHLV